MALYNKGTYGIVQHPTALRFSIGSTMTSPLLMDNINVYLMYPSMHYQPATFYSDVNCDTDLNVQGKCVVGSPSVSESALQVCNYRTVLPTQYGVHAGRDWAEFPGSSNCGINICADNTGVSHLDFYMWETPIITMDKSLTRTVQTQCNSSPIKLREWC